MSVIFLAWVDNSAHLISKLFIRLAEFAAQVHPNLPYIFDLLSLVQSFKVYLSNALRSRIRCLLWNRHPCGVRIVGTFPSQNFVVLLNRSTKNVGNLISIQPIIERFCNVHKYIEGLNRRHLCCRLVHYNHTWTLFVIVSIFPSGEPISYFLCCVRLGERLIYWPSAR